MVLVLLSVVGSRLYGACGLPDSARTPAGLSRVLDIGFPVSSKGWDGVLTGSGDDGDVGLAGTAPRPLAGDDDALDEELAAPDAPGLLALESALEAGLTDGAVGAHRLGELDVGRGLGEEELGLDAAAGQVVHDGVRLEDGQLHRWLLLGARDYGGAGRGGGRGLVEAVDLHGSSGPCRIGGPAARRSRIAPGTNKAADPGSRVPRP